MQVAAMHFKARAGEKLADEKLQAALRKLQGNFVKGRADRVLELDNFEDIRTAAAAIRDRALDNLDAYLEEFERNATARGAVVHWAETTAEVNRIVCELAAQYGVRKAVKSKSMVSEECALNDALEAAGVEVVETDLGEYILQLAHEPPSHIIAPVIHKGRDEIADLFEARHHLPRKSDPSGLTREAREMLRSHFLVGRHGHIRRQLHRRGNGHHADRDQRRQRPHGDDAAARARRNHRHRKVVATLEDVATLLRLLPRSATGQSISNYVSFTTGTAQPDEDGPRHFHIILLDAGRTSLIGSDMQAMLRCIRCGACMNHCPVYQNVGGHAYGWVYPGPMGSILTPTFVGLENALDLPHASTLCNQCGVVCPVKIPLPDLMRKLREKQFERGLRPWHERAGLALWSWAARRPALYAMLSKIGARVLGWMGGADKLIHNLPFGGGWTAGRDLPAPQGKTFREIYGERK